MNGMPHNYYTVIGEFSSYMQASCSVTVHTVTVVYNSHEKVIAQITQEGKRSGC